MLGDLGPTRRKAFGLKSDEDLFDPTVNARAAFQMSHGGRDFGAWGIGPNAYRKMPALDFSGYPGDHGFDVSVPDTSNDTSFSKPKQVFDPSNPFSSVVGGELEDNPFAGVSPTRRPQSIIPERISANSADYSNPFAAIKMPPPAHGKTNIAPVGMVVEGNNLGAQAVKAAATQLGKPYVFGSGPDESSLRLLRSRPVELQAAGDQHPARHHGAAGGATAQVLGRPEAGRSDLPQERRPCGDLRRWRQGDRRPAHRHGRPVPEPLELPARLLGSPLDQSVARKPSRSVRPAPAR